LVIGLLLGAFYRPTDNWPVFYRCISIRNHPQKGGRYELWHFSQPWWSAYPIEYIVRM